MSEINQEQIMPTSSVLLKNNTNNISQTQQNQNQIQEIYKEINDLIENVNSNLVKTFKKQENKLLDNYKKEMIETQTQLKNLQETMNEEEMRKKMIKRKEELEDQRKKFIDESYQISNKGKEFEKQLKKVQNLTQDLQDELKFLDEQLVYSDQNNAKQRQELESLKRQILQYDPDYKFLDEDQIWDVIPQKQSDNNIFNPINNTININHHENLLKNNNNLVCKSANYYAGKYNSNNTNSSIKKLNNNYESPYSKLTIQKQMSVPKHSDDINNAKQQLQKQLDINKKLQSFINSDCFQQSEIEIIFNRCVNNVKKQTLNSNDPFPNSNNNNSSIKQLKMKIQNQINQSNQLDPLNNDIMPPIDTQLTDIQKKKIMEQFLEDPTIKKFIYSILTQQS